MTSLNNNSIKHPANANITKIEKQEALFSFMEKDENGLGMGVLNDGTPT